MTYIKGLKRVFDGSGSDNTGEGALIRSGGKHVTKTITLSANNTSASVNVFQLTGSIQILSLHGEVMDSTVLTNLTNAYFDLWDGANSEVLTKVTGCTMSGAGVGSFFLKDADATVSLTFLNNSQVRLSEPITGAKSFSPFLATQKISTNTYLRFNYTTTDAPINAQLKIDVSWADIDSGTFTAI
jgi:hypothetical protein